MRRVYDVFSHSWCVANDLRNDYMTKQMVGLLLIFVKLCTSFGGLHIPNMWRSMCFELEYVATYIELS